MMQRLLVNASAIALCLLSGTAALNALVAHPLQPTPTSMTEFVRIKRNQPILRTESQWSLFAAGDVMLSRFVAAVLKRESADYPYDHIRGIVSQADIAFANVEHPVADGPPMPHEGLRFRAHPSATSALKDAGFDVLSIANNHMSDNGRDGIAITRDILLQQGFAVSGAGRTEQEAREPAIVEAAGKRIAFLSYGDERFSKQVHFATPSQPGIALASADAMKEDVRAARAHADMVIISLHAGIEYREEPDATQQALLTAAADAGADIVLGHHPHVIQPLRTQGTAWIASSLGNAVFDQMWSEETRMGLLLNFFVEDTRITDIEAIPVYIHNFAQPRIAHGAVQAAALDRLDTEYARATVVEWSGGEHQPVLSVRAMPLQSPPRSGFSIHKTLRDNLNPNRIAELYTLADGRLTVQEDERVLWRSPPDWWVQDVHLADTDGNGTREMVLSVWKSGNYGSSKPFWADDDLSVRNHVFVYGFDDGTLRPVWQSSNLPRPNCEMIFADMDGDRIDELIALEGAYIEDGTCTATTIGIWKWENWGFYKQWRSVPGQFWNARSEQTATGARVIVHGW